MDPQGGNIQGRTTQCNHGTLVYRANNVGSNLKIDKHFSLYNNLSKLV